MMSNGACAPRSRPDRAHEIEREVGSKPNAGPRRRARPLAPRAAARIHAVIAASCRRRQLLLARVSRRDPRAGGHRPEARAMVHIPGCVQTDQPQCVFKVRETLLSGQLRARSAGGPIRLGDPGAAAYSAITAEDDHSTCGVLASRRGGRARTPPSASTCPGPSSPTISASWPSPLTRARSQRRARRSSSSSRPTRG